MGKPKANGKPSSDIAKIAAGRSKHQLAAQIHDLEARFIPLQAVLLAMLRREGRIVIPKEEFVEGPTLVNDSFTLRQVGGGDVVLEYVPGEGI